MLRLNLQLHNRARALSLHSSVIRVCACLARILLYTSLNIRKMLINERATSDAATVTHSPPGLNTARHLPSKKIRSRVLFVILYMFRALVQSTGYRLTALISEPSRTAHIITEQ